MLQIEIVEKAKALWPRSTPAELSLLTKIFSNIQGDKAGGILEDARIDSKYQSLPLKDIKRRAMACGFTGSLSGRYIDCWAVHYKTAKFKLCAVLAQTAEGAKVQMEKYLTKCRVEPTDYTIFAGNGDDTRLAMSDYRMKILGLK